MTFRYTLMKGCSDFTTRVLDPYLRDDINGHKKKLFEYGADIRHYTCKVSALGNGEVACSCSS